MKETVLAMALLGGACVGTAGQSEDQIPDECADHFDSLTCDEACDEGNEKEENVCYRCGSAILGCEDLHCDCVLCYNETDCVNGMRWECEEAWDGCG